MEGHNTNGYPLYSLSIQPDADFDNHQPFPISMAQTHEHRPNTSRTSVNPNSSGYSNHFPLNSLQDTFGQWQDPPMPHYHYAESSRSSFSDFRNSGYSIFSQRPRNSIASTSTTGTDYSDVPQEYHVHQSASLRNVNTSALTVRPPDPAAEEVIGWSPVRSAKYTRQVKVVKEPFPTCVSRPKRKSRSTKEPRYWCTSCGGGFREKCDWIRHEETYQERSAMYQCDLCKKTYCLDKDFIKHHQDSHRCLTCAENNQHLGGARKKRKQRRAWGCGFCIHFDTNWKERCNHIATHFESGNKMTNWKHTLVILSLLKQPHVCQEQIRLYESKGVQNPYFGWNEHTTGRAEGYPDGLCAPQLQDLLEFFSPGQNARYIVELAWAKGYRPNPPISNDTPEPSNLDRSTGNKSRGSEKSRPQDLASTLAPRQMGARRSENQSTHAGYSEKELPCLPPVPPVPLKNDSSADLTSLSENPLNVGFESWAPLTTTIPEDEILPDTCDFDMMDLSFTTDLTQELSILNDFERTNAW
ncbi:uncharacterized protein BDR25DRAFT_292645 [Lindgomyces ingoldianus]|uniref:Uncharacterized protein n=1 Tax=Lindgomyces ingoldianus TaxID=673940 RepID=A0ACB6QJ76_9PLEO|nr:uncharacterized protein BDR25DRAFT_292645 [Lindgomyces ingoldianus]KAF2466950.1 hypothetical protein BDR25DRAFT_292645 [Lindgomyces ingoldianus]